MKKDNLSVIVATVIILAVAATSTAGVPFQGPGGVVSNIDGPSSVVAADFNRDGHIDIAFTAIEAGEVRIRFGGPSASIYTVESEFDRACYVRAADINSDGWLDVVASNRGDSIQVAWWKNPGDAGGPWSERIVAGNQFSQSRAIEVGDLDGDGDLDIVVAGMAGTASYVSWFENTDGAGASWSMRNVSTGGASSFLGPHDAVIADFNGDGRADIAAVAYDSDEVAWFENDGTIHDGDTWPKHSIETGFDGALCIASADLDSDGDPDIVAGAYRGDAVAWFENDLDQGLGWDDHPIDSFLDGVYTVQPVDMDFDGDLDILASARVGDRVVWYETNVWGGRERRDVATGFDGARSAVATDFDSDGDLDVVAAGEYEDDVAWWENLSIHIEASFIGPLIVEDGWPFSPTSVDIADLDLDGDLDIVASLFNDTGDYDFFIWTRDGGSWTGTGMEQGFPGASSVRVADINLDGFPDLVATSSIAGSVRWYRGNPDGGFSDVLVSGHMSGAWDADVADFDCDGDIDIAAVASQSGAVSWFSNDDGAGTSWTEHLITTLVYPTAVRTSDFNRDGNPDIVVSDNIAGKVWAFHAFDCGDTWGFTEVDTTLDGARDVEVGDFNQDGWPDVVAAASVDDIIAVYFFDLSDWSWDRHDVATGFDAWGVAVADIDRDGAPDITGVARLDGDVRWWRNSGTGTSWIGKSPLDTDLSGARAIAISDLDTDGLPDIVAISTEGDTVAMYKGIGGQYFVWNQDVAPHTMGDAEHAAILRIIPVHAGAPGEPDMELRNISLRFDDGTGTGLTSAQANALIAGVSIWYDANGNSELDPPSDLALSGVPELVLDSNGKMIVPVPHGGNNPRIDLSAFYPFFVVVTTTADASFQTPNHFRISHRSSYQSLNSSVLSHYYDWPDMELQPVLWDSFYASTVTCAGLSDEIFSDDFESGGFGQWDSTSP